MHGHLRLALTCLFTLGPVAQAQTQTAPTLANVDPHASPEWAIVAPHLPDPVTGTPQKLETAGDVLRARRFPLDALTFYKSAAINGGDTGRLMKKQGVIHLEMQHGLLARLCFQQSVRFNKRDAEGWNDLGAADFMLGNTREAIGEYKHAVKLNRESAIFHSNLALAYFEAHDGHGARKELARAFALDPDILHHSGSTGYNLQILASTHYAEICYEMARAFAAQGDAQNTISWLTKASERGFDVRATMRNDPVLQPYLQNDEVKVMLANIDQIHAKDPRSKTLPPGLSAAPAAH